MSVRKSDHPERRKLAIMRKADTQSGATHNIGGVRKRIERPKPSLPKMPWDAETDTRESSESPPPAVFTDPTPT